MDITITQIIVALGIPGAITGFVVYWIKRKLEANEKKQLEREANQEKLILMMMQTTRANQIGIEAIARAVQRIPDAKCNGDMEAALAKITQVHKEEEKFLLERGIKYIFE